MFNVSESARFVRKSYEKSQTAYSNFCKDIKQALEDYLKDKNLDGLVRNKESGRVGYLEVVSFDTSHKPYEYTFFPLTSSGKKSKRNEWFYCPINAENLEPTWRDLLEKFEPVEESEDK